MKTITHTDSAFIENIINSCDICFVGVVTATNSPYVIPMNFGYFDKTLYLHSSPEGRVIDCLNHNPNICVTFCQENKLVCQNPEVACSYRMKSTSVIAFGKVSFVNDIEEKRNALNIIMKHYSDKNFNFGDPALKNVKIWTVSIESIGCKEFGAPH
ncbi:MAG: pyridoxamine 5'-phosphate oxidase family protein [Marinilabiliaceae bacterium]|nr:pyridoxamine 5'-phosphate oxidase family protein [Marinilabiliaceae bacterium]